MTDVITDDHVCIQQGKLVRIATRTGRDPSNGLWSAPRCGDERHAFRIGLPHTPRTPYLYYGCDELLQEGVLQQGRPVVVEKINQETLDMGAVLVLEDKMKAESFWCNKAEER